MPPPHRPDLTQVFQHLSDGIIVITADDRVASYNKRYAEIFAFKTGEIRPGDSLEKVLKMIAERHRLGRPGMPLDEAVAKQLAYLRSPEAGFERRTMPDGRIIEIHRSSTPDGVIVSAHIDVTERVAEETRLDAQHRLMTDILNNTIDGVALVDAEGYHIAFNSKFLELYGVPQGSVEWGAHFTEIARLSRGLKNVPEEEREVLIAQRLQNLIDPERRQWTRHLLSGRILNVTKVPLGDGSNVMTLTDVTEMERTRRELEEARQKAEEANEIKSRFLARMSHEMRTPLNGILGVAALTELTGLTPEQSEYLNVIRTSGKVLLRLINDVFDLARMEADSFDLVTEPVDLVELMSGVAELAQGTAAEKGISLSLEAGDAPIPQLIADPVRLHQIVLNLATNAIKFTEEGGVTIKLAAEHDDYTAQIRIAVIDTGIGIAPKDQQKIFAQFYQVEEQETRRYGGVGLGLAICQKLVAAMGGSIDLTSEPGEGSCFSVSLSLPLAEPVFKSAALKAAGR